MRKDDGTWVWTWWYCHNCGSRIRSNTRPFSCICGSWDLSELWFTDPPPDQGQLFKRGMVDRDLTDPDNAEQAARETVRDLLWLLQRFELTEKDRSVLSQRVVPASAHWIPFCGFIHNGRSVGVRSLD